MKSSIINNIATSNGVHYSVCKKGDHGIFCPSGYSKYNERFSLERTNKLPEGEVAYGYEQALEHIRELREHIYNDVKHYKDSEFEIIVTSTSKTIITIPS